MIKNYGGLGLVGRQIYDETFRLLVKLLYVFAGLISVLRSAHEGCVGIAGWGCRCDDVIPLY
jgi:hypothetical protein